MGALKMLLTRKFAAHHVGLSSRPLPSCASTCSFLHVFLFMAIHQCSAEKTKAVFGLPKTGHSTFYWLLRTAVLCKGCHVMQ